MALTDEDVARIADEMERRMSKRDEKPGDASYGLVAERVARTLADSIGVTWKQQ